MAAATDPSSHVHASAFCKTTRFHRGEWQQLSAEPAPSTSSPHAGPTAASLSPSGKLTIVTYNVWFENFVDEVRHPAIIGLLASTNADVICLQEVTQSFLATIRSDAAMRNTYACLGLDGETMKGTFYGCVVLVNRKSLAVRNGRLVDLPESKLNRTLLMAELTGLSGTHTQGINALTIATAHLESPGADYAQHARRAQFQFIRARLPESGAIFCADTNLCTEEEARLPTDHFRFRDAWVDAGHSPDVPTSDSLYKSPYTPRRLDRILYTGDGLQAVSANLIGEAPLKITEPISMDLYLSDHKGVLATLSQGLTRYDRS
ncbi:unnamed protein product [Tilletia laevis]|uniref:Endonuclease/exonuclease/phosphatase domain-containing protein n=2 Tax=Tilletia TaxID=13289 RepID=A0A9N8LLW0_9BASI|nr:unnamed protein product [Tilletia laevis]